MGGEFLNHESRLQLLTLYSEIQDDNYLHAFRIYRDRDSGCVRFEATARRGQMKTIPIWTAFVTQYVGQKSWLKRIGSTTIQLRELHPYVFCDGYTPPRGPSGKYQLTFTTVEGKLCKVTMMVYHTNPMQTVAASWKPSTISKRINEPMRPR